LDAVTSFSSRQVAERHYGLVEIECDDGVTGLGFCYVGSGGATIFTEAVTSLLAPRAVGRDVHAVEAIWCDLYQEALLQGRAGTVVRAISAISAISAIDTAIWDRNARAAGLPLHKYLGTAHEAKVPAYASGGYYLDGKAPQHLADDMQGYVELGYTAVKIKVGRGRLAEEEARMAAVRERIGPEIILMPDANNAWSDLPTALRYLRVYEQYDLYFIEEPFSPDDIDNHVRLAQAIATPVATGEIEVGRWRFKELLAAGGAAILQTDACVCGGVSEFRKIAATAASFGVTVSPHWFHDLHVHLVAATPNARYVEFFPDDQVLNFRRLVDTQLTVRKGHIPLPERPGLGFCFVASELDRYAVTPWAGAGASGPAIINIIID